MELFEDSRPGQNAPEFTSWGGEADPARASEGEPREAATAPGEQ
jgi:hypothetical protein